MKVEQEIPQDGQFIVVWQNDGDIWAERFVWQNGNLYAEDEAGNQTESRPCNLKGRLILIPTKEE